jgi:hypothetical protein
MELHLGVLLSEGVEAFDNPIIPQRDPSGVNNLLGTHT